MVTRRIALGAAGVLAGLAVLVPPAAASAGTITAVSPQPVRPGHVLTIDGTGFPGDVPVNVYWNSGYATPVATINSDLSGNVHGSFTVPSPLANGTYQIQACKNPTPPAACPAPVPHHAVVVQAPAPPTTPPPSPTMHPTTPAPHPTATRTRRPTPTPTPTPAPTLTRRPTPRPSRTTAPVVVPTTPPPAPRPTAVPGSDALLAYDPLAHTRAVVTLQVAAFALLTMLGAGAGATAFSTGGTGTRRGSLASAKVRQQSRGERHAALGDTSRTWRWPGTPAVDRWSLRLPAAVARRSPLLARVLTDGGYARAVAGSLSLLLPVAGLALGAVALASVHGRPAPPSFALLTALVLVGVFDALAGILAGAVLVGGVVVTGGATDGDAVRALLGLVALFFVVPLVASAARPLRRPPSQTPAERFDRLADFTIASLVGAWAVQKMVGALPGLSGRAYPVATRANTVAVAVLAALVVRMLLETLAAALYPSRLARVTPDRLPRPGAGQQLAATAVRTAVFVFVAVAFVGARWQLWVGGALFLVPQALKVYESRYRNLPRVYAVLPRGIVKTVAMLLVGSLSGRWVLAHLHDPAALVADAFVLLSLPGLVLSMLDLVGRDGPRPALRWWHRAAGAGVLALGVSIVTGVVSI